MTFLIDFLIMAISIINAAIVAAIVIVLMPWTFLDILLDSIGASA